ncbi:hypothetical protein BH20CHL7_BH20CHL7_18450 [soil metagenome]
MSKSTYVVRARTNRTIRGVGGPVWGAPVLVTSPEYPGKHGCGSAIGPTAWYAFTTDRLGVFGPVDTGKHTVCAWIDRWTRSMPSLSTTLSSSPCEAEGRPPWSWRAGPRDARGLVALSVVAITVAWPVESADRSEPAVGSLRTTGETYAAPVAPASETWSVTQFTFAALISDDDTGPEIAVGRSDVTVWLDDVHLGAAAMLTQP